MATEPLDMADLQADEIVARFDAATIPLVKPGAFSEDAQGPTDESLAREWVAIHHRDWRFDHSAGAWYRWDGKRWRRDERQEAHHLIGIHLRAASAGRRASVARASVARGVESFARSNPLVAVTHDAWDADPFLLGTPSGTVDLRTGRLHTPDPANQIAMLTTVSPDDGDPVRWLQFLDQALGGDAEMIAFLRQWCGYCLTGKTSEHALLFAYGPGGNGKSVFLNTIVGIMGDYAVTAAMETFTASKGDRHSTELAMLRGARLVTASETEEGRAFAEARIKALTGGDPITARFMRQDNFTFRPQFKLTIAGNHAPTLHNVDDAMKRRLNIVPFTTKPASPDRALEEKLVSEHGQILRWMIGGCLEWQSSGLVRPAAVTGATEEYFADQDLFSQWIEERCEVHPTKWETPAKLFNSWSDYAKDAGEHPGSIKRMKPQLARRGYRAAKTAGLRVYRGLAIRGEVIGDGRDAWGR